MEEYFKIIFTYIVPCLFTVLNIVLWYKTKKAKAKADILKTEAETDSIEAKTKNTTVATLATTIEIYRNENIILQERLQTNEMKLLTLTADFKIMVDGVNKLIEQVKRLDPNAKPDFVVPIFTHY